MRVYADWEDEADVAPARGQRCEDGCFGEVDGAQLRFAGADGVDGGSGWSFDFFLCLRGREREDD